MARGGARAARARQPEARQIGSRQPLCLTTRSCSSLDSWNGKVSRKARRQSFEVLYCSLARILIAAHQLEAGEYCGWPTGVMGRKAAHRVFGTLRAVPDVVVDALNTIKNPMLVVLIVSMCNLSWTSGEYTGNVNPASYQTHTRGHNFGGCLRRKRVSCVRDTNMD